MCMLPGVSPSQFCRSALCPQPTCSVCSNMHIRLRCGNLTRRGTQLSSYLDWFKNILKFDVAKWIFPDKFRDITFNMLWLFRFNETWLHGIPYLSVAALLDGKEDKKKSRPEGTFHSPTYFVLKQRNRTNKVKSGQCVHQTPFAVPKPAVYSLIAELLHHCTTVRWIISRALLSFVRKHSLGFGA
jgi:hypothetical protein